ncbi:hypothetical protein GOODEAATRI_015559 [Goodea atripinnis]|uniref:U3 small nucleolar RNA-associated protein 20 N-terminal domain-containing protein n=1 Tax=Goodea atripinnis TaxID=208336 RepID=A0ABV0NUZ4_9TELE
MCRLCCSETCTTPAYRSVAYRSIFYFYGICDFHLQIRLLTLRIFSQFEAEIPPLTEDEETLKAQSVFAICLLAELVPASVQDYREKLLHLRKLRHDLVQRSLPRGPPGTFPQKELDVTDEDDREEDSGPRDEAGCDVIESGDVGVLFLDQLKLTSNPNERTDFPNFRSLLWRAMAQFPDRVEPRSRELSPLLLRFIRENLERLLDDKHFKEEIVHFNISEETGVVDASHRGRLIPLLMRYWICWGVLEI